LRPNLKYAMNAMKNSDSETEQFSEAEQFSGAKVFFATKARDREALGEKITEWIRANPAYRIVGKFVTQSSDSAFHCLTVTLFYQEDS